MKREWTVELTQQARRAIKKGKTAFPKSVRLRFDALVKDLEFGPKPEGWKHLSVIKSQGYWHCHIKRGNPTFVVCWLSLEKQSKKIEVFYVGSHEGAPYQK